MEVGWIDFSKSDREKVIKVMEALKKKGAVDELGIGVIRDRFANLFFPGTSTIQTRPKYLFLIPEACKKAEKEKNRTIEEFRKSLYQKEKEQCEILCANTDKSNVIGADVIGQNEKWVKRTPSEIYWSALRNYQIFYDNKMTLAEYMRVAVQEREEDEHISFWNIPKFQEEENNTLELTYKQAEFLKEKIITTQKGTLLAYCLENEIKEFSDIEFDDIEETIFCKLSKELQEQYILAKQLSDFFYIMQIRYNVIYSNKSEKMLKEWEDYKKRDIKKIAENVNIDRIYNLLKISDKELKKFLINCKNIIIEKNDFVMEDELDKEIIKREKYKKGEKRAKLLTPIDTNEWTGLAKLTYRMYEGKTIIKDIFDAMEKNNEQ